MTLKFDEHKIPFIDLGNDLRIQLEIDDESSEICQRKAAKELNEKPENVEKAWNELKDLLKGETNLYVPLDNPKFFIKFLRCAGYDSKVAFAHVKEYYRLKRDHPEQCDNITPEQIKHVLEQELITLLPRRDQYGRRILVMQFARKWDPAKCPQIDVFRAMQVLVEALSMEPATQINGCVIINDMEGLSFNQITHMTPSFASLTSEWMKSCAPVCFQGLYIVNNPFIFSIVFQIVKPFMRELIGKKLFVLKKDWATLNDRIGESSLTKLYGGSIDYPEFPGKLLGDLLLQYQKKFEDLNKYGYKKMDNAN